MAYWSYGGCQSWTRVVKTWEKEGKRKGKARLVPEEFVLLTGRIGGTTKLAAMGASPLVIPREGKWSSSTFMVYMGANMEGPQGVLEALSGEKSSGGRGSAISPPPLNNDNHSVKGILESCDRLTGTWSVTPSHVFQYHFLGCCFSPASTPAKRKNRCMFVHRHMFVLYVVNAIIWTFSD